MEIVIPPLDALDDDAAAGFSFGASAWAPAASPWATTPTPSSVTATPKGLPPLRNPFAAAFTGALGDGTSPHVNGPEVMRRNASGSGASSSAHSRTRSQTSAPWSASGHGHHPSTGGMSETSMSSSAHSHGVRSNPSANGHSSRAAVPDSAAAAELALYLVLDGFFERAEQKIAEALGKPIEREISLPAILGAGVDVEFDALFDSIAHVARKLPKLVIDVVMRWRKAQTDSVDPNSIQHAISQSPNPVAARAIADILNERKSLASIYILCRALAAVTGAVTRETLGDELGSKLEDIIFNSLKNADPAQLARSSNRRANMELYARLIGSLSAIRFVSVTDRFTRELEQIERGLVARDGEARIEHIILGMRFLRFQTYPMEAFEEAAEFTETLAVQFDAASGSRIKIAFATALNALFSSVVESATAEVNHPLWARAMQTIHAKAMAMTAKPRYWPAAIPLVCTVVAAAPQDFLLANWQACVDLCMSKLKDRAYRSIALYGIVEVLWAYLHRCHESHSAVAKRLDPLIKALIPPGRRSINPPDAPLDLMTSLPHFVLCRHFDVGQELITSLIAPLPPTLEPNRQPHILDTFAPERLMMAVRATMLALHCMERNEEPRLPPAPPSEDDQSPPPIVPLVPTSAPLSETLLGRASVRGLVDGVSAAIARFCVASEASTDATSILDDRSVMPRSPLPMGPPMPDRDHMAVRRHGAFTVVYPRDRQPYFDLLQTCFDAWPRCLRAESADFRPVDILLNALVHVDPDVAMAARRALERLLRLQDGAAVVRAMGRSVVRPELLYRETSGQQGPTSAKLESLARMWIDFVQGWLDIVRQAANRPVEVVQPHRRLGAPVAPSANGPELTMADIDVNATQALAVEIEACALVLLGSHASALRQLAVSGFRLASLLDTTLATWQAQQRDSPVASVRTGADWRILRVLESRPDLLADADEDRLSSAERTRLQRWRRPGTSSTDTLARIIESDNAIDLALWHLLIGPFFNLVSELSSTVAGVARPLIAARVVRLYGPASAAAGLVPSRAPPTPLGRPSPLSPGPTGGDIAFLAEHWRSHLVMLSALTPATNSTFSPEMTKGEITAERLGSGQEVIRLVIPFLASDSSPLRDGVVRGLGSIHFSLHKPLLDGLNSIVHHLASDRRLRLEQAAVSPGPRRSQRHSRLFLTVARIHELTARLLRPRDANLSEVVLGLIVQYVREAFLFLRDPDAAQDPSAVAMRRPFCVALRALVEYAAPRESLGRYLPLEMRHDMFAALDAWSFRPISISSPETLSRPSAESSTPVRSASLSSGAAAYETFLPAIHVIQALCEAGAIVVRREGSDRAGIETSEILRWVQALFESSVPTACQSAKKALVGLLGHNPEHRSFLEATAFQCFAEPETLGLAQSTFAVLSEAMTAHAELAVKPSTVICLALWKMGHPDLAVRQCALNMLVGRLPPSSRDDLHRRAEIALYNSFAGATLHARRTIGGALAVTHRATEARAVFLELTIRLLQLSSKQTRLLLQLLQPWLVDFVLASDGAPDAVLANLFLLTAKFGDVYHQAVRELWVTLATGRDGGNLGAVLRFLVTETMARGSKEFIRPAQRIIGCLCDGDGAAAVLGYLVDLVQPADMVAGIESPERTPLPHAGSISRRTNLDSYFPISSRRMPLARGQAALVLAGDALLARLGRADLGIPRLIHGLVLTVDHPVPFVRQQARETLVRAATLLVKLPPPSVALSNSRSATQSEPRPFVPEPTWTWRHFWDADDHGVGGTRMPSQMEAVVGDLSRLLAVQIPEVRKLWGSVSLEWATTCPIRHKACRSFQIFRLLRPPPSQPMLAEILTRLSTTASDESPDAQIFAREILFTLGAIVQSLGEGERDGQLLADLPQLVWAAVAAIGSTDEVEFVEAVSILVHVVRVLERSSATVVAAVEVKRPASSAASVDLVRELAQRGLRSSLAAPITWTLLRQLIASPVAARLIAPVAASLPLVYAATLVYGLNALELGSVPAELEAHATAMAKYADGAGQQGIGRLMASLARNRFRTKDDFVRQAIANVVEYFSPSDRVDIFVLYLGQLLNPSQWMRQRTLTVLKSLVRLAPPSEAGLDGYGGDILSPLLRLLPTDLSTAALEVLDESIPLSRQARATSSARPGTAASRRPRTAEDRSFAKPVFGEPSETGWATPDPAVRADACRQRLRDVVDTCAPLAMSTLRGEERPLTFAFTSEVVLDSGPARSQLDNRTQSDVDAAETSTLNDMVDALHSLGDFFDESSSVATSASSPQVASTYRLSLMGASRVAAVLARSFKGRATSPSSRGGAHESPTLERVPEDAFSGAFAEADGAVNGRGEGGRSRALSNPSDPGDIVSSSSDGDFDLDDASAEINFR